MTYSTTNPDPRQPLTPGRRAWLERLERVGIAKRPQGSVGAYCMRAGFTQWVWEKPDGTRVGSDSIPITFGNADGSWGRARAAGWRNTGLETLTFAGRDKLAVDRKV